MDRKLFRFSGVWQTIDTHQYVSEVSGAHFRFSGVWQTIDTHQCVSEVSRSTF